MSAATKTLSQQSKHLTQDERAARAQAESETLAFRPIKKPSGLSKEAGRYWNSLTKSYAELDILDILDREMLMIYCQMLARRDQLNALVEAFLSQMQQLQGDSEALRELVKSSDDLLTKIAALERNIAAYADRLGCTPQSRTRLAQRKAAASEDDPDADFFGD